MDYSTIRYDVADGIATITLNRPEKMNAFTNRMMAEMIDAFDAIDADDAIRAVKLIAGKMADAVLEGKQGQQDATAEAAPAAAGEAADQE